MANPTRPGNGGGNQLPPGGGGGNGGTGGNGGGNLPPGNQGFRGRRVTTCSFCGKSSRDVGPMVEGPSDVYICANCVDLAHNIIRQEKRKLSSAQPLFNTIPSPRQIKEFLSQYVIGQEHAKKGALGRCPQSLQAPEHPRTTPARSRHRRRPDALR